MLALTSNARKQLSSEVLNLAAWKRYKAVTLQEIENALPKKVCNDTNMVSKVERIAKMYTLISVRFVVES